MGFLDHSTNNIIIDAVLTDRGRELLARNDGSFEITKFAFGDDEVEAIPEERFMDDHSCDKACMELAHKSVSSLTVSELVGATMQHAEIVNTCSTRIKSLEN